MKALLRIFVCTAVLFALGGSSALAQGHGDNGQGRNGQDHGRGKDRGRHRGRNFDDRDRQEAHGWYDQHRDDQRFRDQGDWRPDYESRLRDGYVMDPDMRRMVRPIPPDLYTRFGRPPRGYRYVLVGPHVVLVDRRYRVADVIHFELNIR